MKEKKCLYCENMTTPDTQHFTSGCCGRGMCDSCFNGLQGTDEQIQIDLWDTDNEKDEAIRAKYEKLGYSYVCFDHITK